MNGAPTAAMTRGAAFRSAADILKKAGVDNPTLDAAILLGDATGLSREAALFSRNELLDSDQARRFADMVGRRSRREAVSRILGVREFYGMPFSVTPAVLDPRPETEVLVDTSLDLLRGTNTSPAILDMGTGSGAIAVVLARLVPSARVAALDVSEKALAVARRNASSNGVLDRILFSRADMLFAPLPDRSFDLVVSNPPYIGEAEFDTLPPEVRLGDPRSALVAGPRGTELYMPLSAEAARVLRPGGRLAVEIGADQGLEVQGMLLARFDDVRIVRDLAGRCRVVTGMARG